MRSQDLKPRIFGRKELGDGDSLMCYNPNFLEILSGRLAITKPANTYKPQNTHVIRNKRHNNCKIGIVFIKNIQTVT